MKNLLSREEFLNQLDEGFIRDTFRKGINAIKKVFSIGMKKIKNFIVSFDTNGNVLPVVSLQATIDHFAGNKNVQVFAPKEISDSVVAAGGKGCSSDAVYVGDDDDDTESTDGPSGKEWTKWMKEKQFEKSIEYQNFKRIPKIIKEHYSCTDEEADKIFERVFYSNQSNDGKRTTGTSDFTPITPDQFIERMNELIRFKQSDEHLSSEDGKVEQYPGNLLVFGAPGIGKSTIPKQVIQAYNNKKKAFEKMALISVNCANINPGDLMMPNIPKKKDLMGILNQHKDDFPQFAFVNKLDNDKKQELADKLDASGQTVAPQSPKAWLPCYRSTGTDLDDVLDTIANGAIMEKTITTKNEFTNKITTKKIREMTGSGGILLFDEFLRAKPLVFDELMTFLLDGHVDDWYLGSKWVVIACSNRPCDDKISSENWRELGDPGVDRWAQICHLDPDPESWKEWARSKGMEEIILDFIFDEDAKDVDEFSRWHRIGGKAEANSDNRLKPITPRTWEFTWINIGNYELQNKINSILDIPLNKLEEIVERTLGKSMTSEFINWIVQHTGNVDLEQVINDPKHTYPTKSTNDNDIVLIKDLWKQMEKKYSEQKDIPDEELANIFCWLGTFFANQSNIVQHNLVELIDKILPNGGENQLASKHQSVLMLNAAWPTENFENDLYEYTDICSEEKDETKRKNEILKKTKELMKKYFPWRIKGDEIKYIKFVYDSDDNSDDSLE